jgi:hypothetical protein
MLKTNSTGSFEELNDNEDDTADDSVNPAMNALVGVEHENLPEDKGYFYRDMSVMLTDMKENVVIGLNLVQTPADVIINVSVYTHGDEIEPEYFYRDMSPMISDDVEDSQNDKE